MKNIALGIFAFALLCSCSSEEVKISENYIEGFAINNIDPIEINIKNNQSLIYIWTEASLYDSLKSKIPQIKISERAVLSNNKNDNEAWAKHDDFKYIVTAENGAIRSYSIEIDTLVQKEFDFEYWELSEGNNIHYIPASPKWTSGNAGIGLALAILKRDSKNPEIYPTRKTKNGYKGNAVIMETIEGGDVFGRNVLIFSGNFFMGKFNVSKAITDELAATELGYIYPAKPKAITGYYKYKEGPGAFIGFGNPNRQDSCSMNAWFYRSEKDTTLTVRNIDEATDLLIAKATFPGCTDTGGEFRKFELEFDYKNYSPDFGKYNYKLGMAFSASKDGDAYAGKIGSQLIVDEVEIIDDEE